MKPLIIVGGDPEMWGYIPSFLDVDDPRGAKEQFNANYVSGWHHFKGFTFDRDYGTIQYKDDPPLQPLSLMLFRDEKILRYRSAWILVLEPDDSWEICRMD